MFLVWGKKKLLSHLILTFMLPRRMNLSFSIAIPDFSCSVTSWLMLLLLWLKYLNISLMDRAKICCRLSWYPEDGCMPITFVIFLTVHLEFKQIKASTLRWEILSQQTSQNTKTVKTQTNDSHLIKLQILPSYRQFAVSPFWNYQS